MKHTATLLGILAFGAGCAHAGAPPPDFTGADARVVVLPVPAGPGDPREVNMLVDEPTLRVATIVLRDGTLLPEHQSPVAVTIQALSGSGTVIADGSRFPIDTSHAVVLAPDVAHAVEPNGATEPLVLLVHHAGQRPVR